jgi:hypothetical protein
MIAAIVAQHVHHGFRFWTWLGHFTGVSDESGPGYGFFSGIGSDIGEVAIVGAIVATVRHHNCHVTGCKRLGRHNVSGTPYIVCKHHHPDIPAGVITAEHIRALHQASTGTDGTEDRTATQT